MGNRSWCRGMMAGIRPRFGATRAQKRWPIPPISVEWSPTRGLEPRVASGGHQMGEADHMIRFVLAIPLAVALMLLAATSSSATSIFTQTIHNDTETFIAATPCVEGLE